jgi:hypothetical protein
VILHKKVAGRRKRVRRAGGYGDGDGDGDGVWYTGQDLQERGETRDTRDIPYSIAG